MAPSTSVSAQVLAWIDRLSATAGGRALVLGAPEPWRGSLAARGRQVDQRDALDDAALPPGSVDLAIVAESLERTPWDRWTLQLCHRSLAEGGHLVLVVPNLIGLSSPASLVFIVARALRTLILRLRRLLGLPPPRERFTGRRYRRADLVRMLERLGFRIEAITTVDPGWLTPFARLLPTLIGRVSRTHVVLASRLPSLFGHDARRPYPDPEAHRREFERVNGRYLRDRTRWLARHPALAPREVATFDPAAFAGREALVLCPHPDDELIGGGGTLARLIAAGARVTVVHATDGSEAASLWHAAPEVRRTVRLDEARRVGERMGFTSLVFWKEDNAAFVEREPRVQELAALLERLRPALVFTPFVTDIHPDHRVLSRMLARAFQAAPHAMAGARVLGYAVWSAVPANLVCDVTGEVDLQEEALLIYATAMKVDDYVHFCQDRNYHDAVAVTGRPGFVESYFACSAQDYPGLVAAMEGSDG
jgi:LmbE family N-acetylglucosaminyl deacetylase